MPGILPRVRWLLAALCLTITAPLLRAQTQERTLEDRLLRPNMTLANPAQNKKFVAVEGTSIDKKFSAKNFTFRDSHSTKAFADTRDFSAKSFSGKNFERTRAAQDAKKNADAAFAQTEFSTHKSALIRESSAQHKSANTRTYADNRPFLAKGSRQKILDQQNAVKPLTIDQVRELLNTNR